MCCTPRQSFSLQSDPILIHNQCLKGAGLLSTVRSAGVSCCPADDVGTPPQSFTPKLVCRWRERPLLVLLPCLAGVSPTQETGDLPGSEQIVVRA